MRENGGIDDAALIIGAVLLMIFFHGEPDLVDALIHYLMN